MLSTPSSPASCSGVNVATVASVTPFWASRALVRAASWISTVRSFSVLRLRKYGCRALCTLRPSRGLRDGPRLQSPRFWSPSWGAAATPRRRAARPASCDFWPSPGIWGLCKFREFEPRLIAPRPARTIVSGQVFFCIEKGGEKRDEYDPASYVQGLHFLESIFLPNDIPFRTRPQSSAGGSPISRCWKLSKNSRSEARVMAVYSQRANSPASGSSGLRKPWSTNTACHCPPCALWQVRA